MIKYLGSKRTLIPKILDAVAEVAPSGGAVLDLFSGTSRVGHALKGAGYAVVANDHNAYAATIGACYVAANPEVWRPDVERLVAEMNALPGEEGWFTENYSRKTQFFQPKNGARIDAIRTAIRDMALPPTLEAILLVSLMEAADRVDSTTGIQMAHLKQWAPRANNDLHLRVPDMVTGTGLAFQCDALEFVESWRGGLSFPPVFDVAYLDPPYNQHKYIGNYHIWETLVLWDKPEVYGVVRKRVDVRERNTDFNSKVRARAHMEAVLKAIPARSVVVSFSDEGYISRDEMVVMLSTIGTVEIIETAYDRYVGAKIGIHNPKGVKVGQVKKTRNVEYIFICRR